MNNLAAKLHPFERKTLPVIGKETALAQLVKQTQLQEIEVMRALQWLANKDLIVLETQERKLISLAKNGKIYKKQGLPEKALLQVLSTEEFKPLNVVTKKAKLSREEVSAALGQLKRGQLIEIKKDEELTIKKTQKGQEAQETYSPIELFLSQEFPLNYEQVEDEKLLKELLKRKEFIAIEKKKLVSASRTPQGDELAKQDLSTPVTGKLTQGMLKTGSWREQTFRAYDVEINVPQIHRGKKHFVSEAVEYIRSIWLEMGFQEMQGNYAHSAFWDLDTLFVPQDHPAREMQDTFYLPGKAKLPKELLEKVKAVHETGEGSNSKGWQYNYSNEEAQKVLLRTHTTVLSAQTLANLKEEELPAKFFAVGKVFRNEALDWKHLFEFYQVEGIVIDPDANLKDLKGYLTQFYKKMGFEKVRMRPAHFPYTEPSLEVDVFHPVKQEWVELGGAGIFRPEVVIPLFGKDVPVLAWGQGMGRIISEYWKITDIRQLYKNDVKQLRETKTWLK